jgi:tRNA (mo5U34)-methyltransferase
MMQEDSPLIGPPAPDTDFGSWLTDQVEQEPYWFHQIELPNGLTTPGWSQPRTQKLPFYGLPESFEGLRVLDVGCAEGFFSFEAERRGAAEVVAIDSFPDSVRRFNICRAAFGSKATAYLANVYELNPRTFGTFDLVMFYGVLYHLRHPLLALEKIHSVCTGTVLVQTAIHEIPGAETTPFSRFYPRGMDSGPDEDGKPLFDPTIFWLPNRECVRALVDCADFRDIETVCDEDHVSIVVRARSNTQEAGCAPDQMTAPWS